MEPSDQLDRIEARLARIERGLDLLEQQAPAAMAVATDALDDFARRYPDIEQRLQGLSALAERLSRPETLRAMRLLVDYGESLPQLAATFIDALDDLAAQAAKKGVSLATISEDLKVSLSVIVKAAPKIRAALEAGMFDKPAIDTLERMGKAAATVQDKTPTPVGLFGALKAMSDPEVKRSLGFAIEMARAFGQNEIAKKMEE